jgi:biopolymer transport protein ExbD/biopolymer transport protein TolR
MASGGPGGLSSDINVTPLIDVLLVLLIIFMVIVPVTPKGLEALVPQPPKDQKQQPDNDRTIVVEIQSNGAAVPTYKINDQSFAKQDLEPELQKIFSIRVEKVMFIKGDPNLNFGTVAQVIGMGHQADVTNIGIMTPQVLAGH